MSNLQNIDRLSLYGIIFLIIGVIIINSYNGVDTRSNYNSDYVLAGVGESEDKQPLKSRYESSYNMYKKYL